MTSTTRYVYRDAVRALGERGRFGVRLGLARTRALLRELGNPHRELRGALVAGTNGKGSVLALCGAVLRAAGYRVGETPKPHLVSYRERLQIDGRPIEPERFAELVGQVLSLVERVARRHGEPTEFELLTAMLFRWFADEGVEVALVEVGLGGRLDATNAWHGGVAAITNVDLDHTDRLGSTIPEIAREKAAIIKRGDVAVTGASGDALSVIRKRARETAVDLRVVEPARLVGQDRDGIIVELGDLGEVRVGLRGRHQAANVAVANGVLDALTATGIAPTSRSSRIDGFAGARWPGRLELVQVAGRDVLLDGAHNPAGAAALAIALADLAPHLAAGPATLLTATMADKDVDGIVHALATAPQLRRGTVICTRVDVPRALAADELARRWRTIGDGVRLVVEPDVDAALDAAMAMRSGPLIVAGSLYLVGAVRARLVDDPLLRDPAE